MDKVAYINLDNIEHNISALNQKTNAQIMVIVKADAYGHANTVKDIIQIIDAAKKGGATYVGVAHLDEAIALRKAGLTLPIMAWLHTSLSRFEKASELGIEIGVSSLEELLKCAYTQKTTTVHLKINTGLGRNGIEREDWHHVFQEVAKLQKKRYIKLKGIFSHFAVADDPLRKETYSQISIFEEAIMFAKNFGLNFRLKHIANTAAMLAFPESHYNMVRVGLGMYGLKPFKHSINLKPVMTLMAKMSKLKQVSAGYGVSYGLRYYTDKKTTLGLIPIGYADGIPRNSIAGPVYFMGRTCKTVGTVSMDQIVVDLNNNCFDTNNYKDKLEHDVIIFGSYKGVNGPSVDDWAQAANTINCEIITRIGKRVPRILYRSNCGH